MNGTVSRDFRHLGCFIKQLHLGPWSTEKSIFEYRFELAEIFDYEIADFVVTGVNDTVDQQFFVELTHIFLRML
jgi:hypothetical protein